MCFSTSFFFHRKKTNKQTSWSGRIFAWKICSGYFPIDYNYVISGLLPYAQINACFRSSVQCSSFNLILSSFKMKGNELNVLQKETLNLYVVLAVLSQFYSKHFKVYISPQDFITSHQSYFQNLNIFLYLTHIRGHLHLG